MTFSSTRVLVPLALLAVLSACSWFHGGTHDYKHASETAPLEVPPGLDAPPRGSELTIPGDQSAHPSEHPAGAAPPAGEAHAAGGAQPAYVGTETSLVLQDDVTNSYRRVGLALERSAGVVSVTAHDDIAASYTVTRQTLVEKTSWWKKVLGQGAKPETVTRVVHVVPEGQGARVQVEDPNGHETNDETARTIIGALKSRLE